MSEPDPDPPAGEGPAPLPGSNSGQEPPTVGRGAWLLGWAAGIGVAALGLSALSFYEPGKFLKVVLEMAVVAASLLVTTQIWSRSAALPPATLDSPPGAADRKGLESDRHDA